MSIRGRPNSFRGINSNRTTRPVPSFTGLAPTRAKAIAIDSPCYPKNCNMSTNGMEAKEKFLLSHNTLTTSLDRIKTP